MARGDYKPQQRSAQQASLPAPVMGLNTVDALADMDPRYGLSIQNFEATPQGLSVRQGYKTYATALPTSVTSLLPYHAKTSSASKLFAVSGTAIYDVTNAGAVGAPVVTGLNAGSPYWQSTLMTNGTGGTSYLVAVNGTDTPRMFDGTNWTTCSTAASPSAPGQFNTLDNNGTAVNLNAIVDVLTHQQRLWFVKANSTIAYYAPIAAVGGQLSAFDFGAYFPTGGKLQKLSSWSTDLGGTLGIQTVLVVVSDHGDVLIYAGQNPATATTWGISGQFKIGSPIGRRCTTPFAGDLLILTQDGLCPMSKYAVDSQTKESDAITYKISPTISNLVSAYSTTPGFEMINYPGNDALILNVPQSSQSNNFQFCMNTETNGWTQFTGWGAQCFALFNDNLYFGGTNFVALAFQGYQDGAPMSGSGGNNIVATAMSAFTTLSQQLQFNGMKTCSMVKPYFITGQSNPSIQVGLNTDFNLTPITGTATLTPASGAVWDNALWGNPNATWVGSPATNAKWTGVLAYPANYLAVVVSISATTYTLWSATDFMVTPGGLFG
jgi:hypothetical protein